MKRLLLLVMVLSSTYQLFPMEDGTESKVDRISRLKAHIFNQNSDQDFFVHCFKYMIDRRNEDQDFYGELYHYATESFLCEKIPNQSVFNLYKNTYGVLHIMDGLEVADGNPLLNVYYCWTAGKQEVEAITLHIYHGAFKDIKSVKLNSEQLRTSTIALVLKGENLQDSFFCTQMPEMD